MTDPVSLERVAWKLDEAADALEAVPDVLRARPATIFGFVITPATIRAEAIRIRSVAVDLRAVTP